MKLICNRCGGKVVKEVDTELKKEYPYYCLVCDENMYSFEVTMISEIVEKSCCGMTHNN